MKKVLSLCLILVLLVGFFGCSADETPENTAEFYYLRSTYVYGAENGVIAPEIRDISNRNNTMLRLLMLYLQGPLDPELRSPFPAGCNLLGVSRDGSTLCVTLDSSFSELENLDLTIACACIAKTCFSLADVTQVQIRSQASEEADSVNVILSIDSLLLDDNSGLPQQTITEESQ